MNYVHWRANGRSGIHAKIARRTFTLGADSTRELTMSLTRILAESFPHAAVQVDWPPTFDPWLQTPRDGRRAEEPRTALTPDTPSTSSTRVEYHVFLRGDRGTATSGPLDRVSGPTKPTNPV